MIQPVEMKTTLPMALSNGVVSTTTKVWETLTAARNGDMERLKKLFAECPELVYCQYNYTPPIHFAVREGHIQMVNYLLEKGALDPTYVTYPFNDTLLTVARDRGLQDIMMLLQHYLSNPGLCRFRGDNGEIKYGKDKEREEFEKAVNNEKTANAERILKEHPEFALDETASWGEGILMMPAKGRNRPLIDLLLSHGARVPDMSKWGRAYYFKHNDIADFLLEKGMNPNHMTWHHVTLLHDMAHEGDTQKAKLLIRYGADIDPVEEEFQSTPLGIAARCGHREMVELLLEQGADPNKSGASWSTPMAWAQKKGHAVIEGMLKEAGAM